jgi:hypothetical protein
LTSALIAPTTSARSEPPPARREGTGRAGAAGAAAAISAAWARVIPQWQVTARRGTRRPQLGQDQVWEEASTTAVILEQVGPGRV